MKELLEQLGLKDEQGVYLPMLSEFMTEWYKAAIVGALPLSDLMDYKNFITQPLKKEMFVPCLDGVVLSAPKDWEQFETYGNVAWSNVGQKECDQYQQAMQKVLFDGWEYYESKARKFIYNGDRKNKIWSEFYLWEKGRTIEQAINNGVKLYLK